MQSYQGNANDYMRRGNCGRNSRNNSCQNTVSVPVSVYENRTTYENRTACMETDGLAEMELAMAYVPWQVWRKIYCPEQAFKTGTIFEELSKPFLGMGGYR